MVAQLDSDYIDTSAAKTLSRLVAYTLFEGRPLTTRGRWINHLVFGNARLLRSLPFSPDVEKPIFIIGTGRSGTTVLGLAMSMHRDVGFLNEPKALWHSAYAYEDLTGNYTHSPAKYRLTADDATRDVAIKLRRLYSAYSFITRQKRVLDKYPELVFRADFVRAIFPDALFIFLVRSGLDTCRSIESWSRGYGINGSAGREDWWGVNDRKWNYLTNQLVAADNEWADSAQDIAGLAGHNDRAAVEWVLTMKEGLNLLERYPDHVKMLRYEDLIASPTESMRGIFDFCDLAEDDRALSFAAGKLQSKARTREDIDLSPLIREQFDSTMKLLGY